MKAIEFLQQLHPAAIWSITAIEPVDDSPKITTKAFPPDQADRAKKAAAFLKRHEGKNGLYYSLARLVKVEDKKSKIDNVGETIGLHVDIDARPGHDLADELKRIRGLLTDKLPDGVPRPTWIIYTGGGYQAIWILDQPIPVFGNQDPADEVFKYNKRLEAIFAGDTVSNCDRILRLPNQTNIPKPAKVAKGRVAALTEVLDHNPEAVYPLSAFAKVTTSTRGVSGLVAEKVDTVTEVGLEDCLAGVVMITGGDPDDPDRWTSRSEALYYFVCEAMRRDVPEAKILGILTDDTWKISESVLEKKNADTYARKQIEASRVEVHGWFEAMNARWAVVGDVGSGRCMIIYEHFDEPIKRWKLCYQDEAQWKKRFANKFVMVPAPTAADPDKMARKTKADAWLVHPKRREYDTITFWPAQDAGEETYNLWQGYGVTAVESGDRLHLSYLRHLYCNICREAPSLLSPDEAQAQGLDPDVRHLRDIDPAVLLDPPKGNYWYLIRWLARAVQHPDQPGLVAVAMRGPKGSGKSFMAKRFGFLFGRHFWTVTKMHLLTGQFTGHLRDLVVLFGDEALASTNARDIAAANGLITDDQLVIEAKGKDAILAANFIHLILATDSNFVAPAGENERRYFVLDIDDAHNRDIEYFGSIAKDFDIGGAGDLLHFLQTLDLDAFDVWADMPETRALGEDQATRWWMENEAKVGPVVGFLQSGLQDGSFWKDDRFWIPQTALIESLATPECDGQKIGRLLKKAGAIIDRPGSGERLWHYVFDGQMGHALDKLKEAYPLVKTQADRDVLWPESEVPF
jgi:hypothetical protein